MRILVAYTSKTGFTKTYAEWIAEDLGAELVTTKELTRELIRGHDVIVHGGGNRAGNIGGLSKFLKHWDELNRKHVALWYTGASPANPQGNAKQWAKVLTEDQLEHTEQFYLRGGFDMSLLRGTDKLIMSSMGAAIRRKRNPSPADKGILNMIKHPNRELDRDTITPLVEHVRSLASA
ncbi:MAG: flavodoxin domain-containing protein [Gulosibacter sp.]|uniref:flavodoxin domain-containing protein n=1 Tax=Gulosibacter sp. TaxID=2817531 RepID=UPI003F9290D2